MFIHLKNYYLRFILLKERVNKMSDMKYLNTDILIIGAGPSGMWTAKHLKELNSAYDVTVVDKAGADWGGLMSMSEGDFDAITPEENLDEWIRDLVYYWDGLCDQELMERLFSKSYDRLCEYEKLGCSYIKNENGSFKGIPQRGLDHFKLRITKVKGTGGEDMRDCLNNEADRLEIHRLGRTMITELLKKDGHIIGAVGFNIRSGEFISISAKAVVIACGRAGWKSSYGKNTSTGEGLLLAYNAGAKLTNMEFVEVWNVPKLFSWEGQTVLLPLGAKFVNSQGEPFMDRYSPVLRGNTDPHYTTMAMAMEAREGRSPIYFDTSDIKNEDRLFVQPAGGWQLLNHEKLKDIGIDFFNGKTEWQPQILSDFGGIVADEYGFTGVEGLYAVGRSRFLDAGVYIGGFDLSTTSTTGYLAAEGIYKYLEEKNKNDISVDEEIIDEKKAIYDNFYKKGIPSKQVLRKIQELVFPYDVSILKNEQSLQFALDELKRIQEELIPQMGSEDPHYLMKSIETSAIAQITEMYLKASLMRRETRGGHYREDYPHRNDNEWLGWIKIYKNDKGMQLGFDNLPREKYKHSIEKYYQDNFCFPDKKQFARK